MLGGCVRISDLDHSTVEQFVGSSEVAGQLGTAKGASNTLAAARRYTQRYFRFLREEITSCAHSTWLNYFRTNCFILLA